jgi:hypothetical protein
MKQIQKLSLISILISEVSGSDNTHASCLSNELVHESLRSFNTGIPRQLIRVNVISRMHSME